MKKDISSFLIIILITSLLILTVYCSRSDTAKKEEKKLSKHENQVIMDELTNIELENEGEKIILLSLIHKVPADSLHSILKEYYLKTSFVQDYKYLDKVIDTISEKFKIPKTKIAFMIYQFKYDANYLENHYIENDNYIPDYTSGADSESTYRF